MRYPFTCILCAFILLISCKKEDKREEVVFKGNVAVEFVDETAANIDVIVYGKVYESGSFNTTSKKLGSSTTDHNGDYEVTIPSQNYVELSIKAESEKFFPHLQNLNVDAIENNEDNEVDFSVKPKATLRITIRNANPFNHEDYAEYRNFRTFDDCACCSGSPIEFFGTDVDTTFSCDLYGGHYMLYRLRYNRTFDQTIDIIDSILCEPFETTELELNY